MCDSPMGIQEEDDLNSKLHHALRCIQRSQELGKEGKHKGEMLFLRAVVWDLLAIVGANNPEVKQALQERARKFLDGVFRDMEKEDLDDDGEED